MPVADPITLKFLFSVFTVPVPESPEIVSSLLRMTIASSAILKLVRSVISSLTVNVPLVRVNPPAVNKLILPDCCTASVPYPRFIDAPSTVPVIVKFLFLASTVPVPERLLIVAVLGRISVAPPAILIFVVVDVILLTVRVPAFSLRAPAANEPMLPVPV